MKKQGYLLTGTMALALSLPVAAMAQDELNALVWCDHTDPKLIEPFEEAHGVKVNLREYEGTGSALALLEQSRPGDWDVLVIDGIDVFRALDANLLAELPADQLPLADQFPEIVLEANNQRDGKIYAITEKFGYNTVSYNSAKVDPEDMKNFDTILSGKYKDRITIYDYYLPLLGMISLANGIDTKDLNADNLEQLRGTIESMRANARNVADLVASQTALATGEVDIVIGGGEWLTAVLTEEQPELDWTIPEHGAVLWSQSIGVLESSENKDLALEFVKYITSPEGQSRLATSACFWGMPANTKAGAHLDDRSKGALRWDEQIEYLTRSQLYPAPDADLDIEMQDFWLELMQQ